MNCARLLFLKQLSVPDNWSQSPLTASGDQTDEDGFVSEEPLCLSWFDSHANWALSKKRNENGKKIKQRRPAFYFNWCRNKAKALSISVCRIFCLICDDVCSLPGGWTFCPFSVFCGGFFPRHLSPPQCKVVPTNVPKAYITKNCEPLSN